MGRIEEPSLACFVRGTLRDQIYSACVSRNLNNHVHIHALVLGKGTIQGSPSSGLRAMQGWLGSMGLAGWPGQGQHQSYGRHAWPERSQQEHPESRQLDALLEQFMICSKEVTNLMTKALGVI